MKKAVKKLVFLTLALVSIVAVSLAIHLYDVMGKPSKKGDIQIARIDVLESFEKTDAVKIKKALNQIEGVNYSFMNKDSRRLIFSFNPKTHRSEEIFKSFSEKVSYQTKLYQPSEKLAASGCPAIAREGITGRISSLFD